jgi:hypothetical protein
MTMEIHERTYLEIDGQAGVETLLHLLKSRCGLSLIQNQICDPLLGEERPCHWNKCQSGETAAIMQSINSFDEIATFHHHY